jgi:pimeloyl-ACP methyl ester carboxylesterase
MRRRTALLLLCLVCAATAPSAQVKKNTPLTIRDQGSFFVGGENKTVTQPAAGPIPAQSGEITINQMYVQYQIPMRGSQHVPVVMVHGCCLSSKTWETTPDGRMGWNEYFLRRDRSVYLADQVSRARSGFDPTGFLDVRQGNKPAAQMPGILDASHQIAWTVFRFGPKYGEAFSDGQFPIDSVDELYKQMIPDLNSTLPMPNPTWKQMAALATKLHGAVLMGHSESGFFPEEAALIDPSGVRGIISIEMPCRPVTPEQLATLAKIPSLFVFGDHLGDVSGGPANWQQSFNSCGMLVDQLKKAGGDATMMHLPAMGIKGNSHMLMQDKNSDQIAELVIGWLDKHVESKNRGTR